MVGKLLKHEFRATARVMLLVYAALTASAVLANLSFRFMEVDSVFLRIVFGLWIALFVIGVVAAVVVTAVVMIGRFYRSLLKEQGYLMHTLPVSVHGHIWSKLIVSLVWFAATFVLIWLLLLLTALIQSGTELGVMFSDMPSIAEIRAAMAQHDVHVGGIVFFGIECVVMAILACLTVCLHFYAAMSLGHMFSKNQILLSIVFYIGINFVFSILGTGAGMMLLRAGPVFVAETFTETVAAAQAVMGRLLLIELVHAAILYAATFFPLKKGLNLA